MRGKIFKGAALILAIVIAVLAIAVTIHYFSNRDIAVLQPRGTISHSERNLIFLALALCAIVVIPVFALTILITTRYRDGSKKRTQYSPDWDGDRRLELTWWGIPLAIITILAIVTWISSYSLDPYKALSSSAKPLNVQVVALDWKWLFIYPDQNIATVNYLKLPVNTPVNLTITSDSVMNSFWIPNLAGQIYAMTGMKTQLHIIATQAGNYPGSSANISGHGFSKMHFVASATSAKTFNNWLLSVKNSTDRLDLAEYQSLAKPSTDDGVKYYASTQKGLFDWIVYKYMVPSNLLPAPGMTPMNMHMSGESHA